MDQFEQMKAQLQVTLVDLEAKASRVRKALELLSDDEEDAAAGYRQPGALAAKLTPEIREAMENGSTGLLLEPVLQMLADGPLSRAEIEQRLRQAGHHATKSNTLALMQKLIDNNIVRLIGSGKLTRYQRNSKVAQAPAKRPQRRWLTESEREAMTAKAEELLRQEPLNTTQLFKEIESAGVPARRGAVTALMQLWRGQGKVELIEAIPGALGSRQWRWIGDNRSTTPSA